MIRATPYDWANLCTPYHVTAEWVVVYAIPDASKPECCVLVAVFNGFLPSPPRSTSPHVHVVNADRWCLAERMLTFGTPPPIWLPLLRPRFGDADVYSRASPAPPSTQVPCDQLSIDADRQPLSGSSTMPQMRNPISSELMLAFAEALRQHARLMVNAMSKQIGQPLSPSPNDGRAFPGEAQRAFRTSTRAGIRASCCARTSSSFPRGTH